MSIWKTQSLQLGQWDFLAFSTRSDIVQLNRKFDWIERSAPFLLMCVWKVSVTIFTVRKRSCRKVMFLRLSVILFTGGGCLPKCMLGYTPWAGTPLGRHPPADGYCCGCNASYWNAFLFLCVVRFREECILLFSKWRDFRPIRWIRRILQNHSCMNRIQLHPHKSTENILV